MSRKSPEISILMPVYNAQEFLSDSIDSILAQTFTNFEIILVNDGSKDNSGKICDDYARSDERIKVIHKKNGGASSARNAAVDAAQGRFIGWVDADDWIEPDMYETLYNYITEYEADIADCQYFEIRGENVIRHGRDESIVFGENDFILREFFSARMKPTLWSKLYRRELWEGIRFPLGRNHQDTYVNLRFVLMPLRYVRSPEAKYHYIIRENSITTTKTSRELRETIYKYDYTMKLAATCEAGSLARKLLKKDAINRLMTRYFEVSVNSELNNQHVYNHIVRKKLGFSLFTYILFKDLPIKTKVSFSLLMLNMKRLQAKLHKLFGKQV